jgi:hypothetical protein
MPEPLVTKTILGKKVDFFKGTNKHKYKAVVHINKDKTKSV